MSETGVPHNGPIVVVDDEADLVATYERVLRRKGYHVISATSRDAGLALVEREPLVLLLTDVHLPDGSGLDLVRAARRLPTPVPAIVVTAFDSKAGRTAALGAGASDYLVKPFALSTFAVLVENTLAHRPSE
jgi:two-component system response regulator PilR (NtrC family)